VFSTPQILNYWAEYKQIQLIIVFINSYFILPDLTVITRPSNLKKNLAKPLKYGTLNYK